MTLFAAATLVVGLAACGDDDDDDTAVGADDTSETTEAEGDDHDMGDDEGGNPCAPDAPDDVLPPAEELGDGEPLTITAKDYEFEGADALAAGGTFAITFENEGTELHELMIVRLADAEVRPLEEIIASGEEPEMTEIGFGIACPGDSTTLNAEISEPGRYVAVCLVPVGMTAEATGETDGPPHAAQGMVFEFEIS
jgi:hypothetical protein